MRTRIRVIRKTAHIHDGGSKLSLSIAVVLQQHEVDHKTYVWFILCMYIYIELHTFSFTHTHSPHIHVDIHRPSSALNPPSWPTSQTAVCNPRLRTHLRIRALQAAKASYAYAGPTKVVTFRGTVVSFYGFVTMKYGLSHKQVLHPPVEERNEPQTLPPLLSRSVAADRP